jgi:hypothetical protein
MHPPAGAHLESDASGKRSHAVSDLQEGTLMAAYRMFPPVGPDRADELAAGDTSVDSVGELLQVPDGSCLRTRYRTLGVRWAGRP